MLALHVTHVLDTMTPYIAVPWHTVVCLCVCVCAKYNHSTVSIDIYRSHYYGNDVGCHGV